MSTEPRKPSAKAVMACARWLVACKKLGWPESDLDELQEIWWRYHDDAGEFVTVTNGEQR